MTEREFSRLPKHLGVIMDGNGRWAQQKHFPRVEGHKNASTAVRETVETCARLKIKVLTLFAFSTENWGRPAEEIELLMRLFEEYLHTELPTMTDNNIFLRVLGERSALPDFVQKPLDKALELTKNNTGLTLCLAINYGSRQEILRAAANIAQKVKDNLIDINEIDEELFSRNLYTSGLSDPDLIIRTSGEMRLSNFLLWQAAYSEFYFTPTLWPDFNKDELYKALEVFAKRGRRLGKVDDGA